MRCWASLMKPFSSRLKSFVIRFESGLSLSRDNELNFTSVSSNLSTTHSSDLDAVLKFTHSIESVAARGVEFLSLCGGSLEEEEAIEVQLRGGTWDEGGRERRRET